METQINEDLKQELQMQINSCVKVLDKLAEQALAEGFWVGYHIKVFPTRLEKRQKLSVLLT
jgi:hypothetical protein